MSFRFAALLLVLVAKLASAAPTALDSAAATNNSNDPAAYSVSAGSNRKLICASRYNDATPDLITAATYGGESMTEIIAVTNSADHVFVFELDETGIAAAASTTVAYTYAPGTPVDFRSIHICMSFQDAKQAAVTVAVEDSTNDDPLTVDVTGIANSLGVGFCSVRHGNGTGSTHAWENSWTEQVESDSDDADVTASLAIKALSAGSDTAQCNPATGGASNDAATIVALRLDAVVAASSVADEIIIIDSGDP